MSNQHLSKDLKFPCVYEICTGYVKSQAPYIEHDFGMKVLELVRVKNWKSLSSLFLDHLPDYRTAHQARVASQISALFKKNVQFSDRKICASSALESFKASERICLETNRRWAYPYEYFSMPTQCWHGDRMWLRHLSITGWEPDMFSQVVQMQDNIKHVLGDITVMFKQFTSLLKVTTGASAHNPRSTSQPCIKLSRVQMETSEAAKDASSVLYQYLHGTRPEADVISICDHNRVQFVPKTSLTDRAIACEPTYNLLLQGVVGSFMRARLKLFGINLSDQRPNQRLAREGSLNDSFATVDLQSASDTIATNVVAALLPPQWFKFLDSIRSKHYSIGHDIDTEPYHKFSSMGNDFTFPLQSLIYWSACKAVGSKSPVVYGDDIVLESSLYHKVGELLNHLGFKVNHDKSYYTGPFRESCGKDYFNGCDIRPFFWRTLESKADLCHIINGLIGVVEPSGFEDVFIRELAKVAKENNLHVVPFSDNTREGVHVNWRDFVTSRWCTYVTPKVSHRMMGRTKVKYVSSGRAAPDGTDILLKTQVDKHGDTILRVFPSPDTFICKKYRDQLRVDKRAYDSHEGHIVLFLDSKKARLWQAGHANKLYLWLFRASRMHPLSRAAMSAELVTSTEVFGMTHYVGSRTQYCKLSAGQPNEDHDAMMASFFNSLI